MHTPQQAHELWCPMVRIARIEPTERLGRPDGEVIVAGCNTDALGGYRIPASCRCIADKCAMWRWQPDARLTPGTGELVVRGYDGWIPAKGFCGLAGVPTFI